MVEEQKVYGALILDFGIVHLFEGYDMDEIVDMVLSYMNSQYKQYEEANDYLLLKLDKIQYETTSEYLAAHDSQQHLQEAERLMFGERQ